MDGRKIDTNGIAGALLTDSDAQYLKAEGARALPDNPTAAKWSGAAIKRQLYRQAEILFQWLKHLGDAVSEFSVEVSDYLFSERMPKVYAELADAQEDLAKGDIPQGSVVFVLANSDFAVYVSTGDSLLQVGQSYKTFLNRITQAESDIDALQSGLSGAQSNISALQTKANKNEADIAEMKPKVNKAESDLATVKPLVTQHTTDIAGLKTSDQNQLATISKITSGELHVGYAEQAGKASTDGEGNVLNVDSYGVALTASYESATGKIVLSLINGKGETLDTETLDLPGEMVITGAEYDDEAHKIVFTLAGGGTMEIPLSDLVDTYTGGTSADGIVTVTVDGTVIKASVADGSIPMAKLSPTLQTTWNGWVSAEAARVLAENQRIANENQRIANENARLARPYLYEDYDEEEGKSYLSINYGSEADITID